MHAHVHVHVRTRARACAQRCACGGRWVPWGVSGLAWLVYFSCAMSVQDEYLLFSYLARFKAHVHMHMHMHRQEDT